MLFAQSQPAKYLFWHFAFHKVFHKAVAQNVQIAVPQPSGLALIMFHFSINYVHHVRPTIQHSRGRRKRHSSKEEALQDVVLSLLRFLLPPGHPAQLSRHFICRGWSSTDLVASFRSLLSCHGTFNPFPLNLKCVIDVQFRAFHGEVDSFGPQCSAQFAVNNFKRMFFLICNCCSGTLTRSWPAEMTERCRRKDFPHVPPTAFHSCRECADLTLPLLHHFRGTVSLM